MSARDAAGLTARARVAVWTAATLHGEGGAGARVLRLALRPAGAIVAAVTRARATRGRVPPATAPYVVAVGGLTLGGSGKTPLVARLAQDLVTAGIHPAIVTRGYGGRTPRSVVRAVAPLDAAREVGDEPLALARLLAPGTCVIVARDRSRGIALAHAGGAEVVLLDDAFQTRGVERHADVVALDARRPVGAGRVLPAGDLREPAAGLARATAIVLTRIEHAKREEIEDTMRLVRRHAPQALLATARHVPVIRTGPPLAGRRVWILSGVAAPRSVDASVRALGGVPVGRTTAPDHHVFTNGECMRIVTRAQRAGADVLALTDKDAARAGDDLHALLPMPHTVVGVELAWEKGGDVLVERLLAGTRAIPGRPL